MVGMRASFSLPASRPEPLFGDHVSERDRPGFAPLGPSRTAFRLFRQSGGGNRSRRPYTKA